MKTIRPFIIFFFILSLAYRIVLPAQAQVQNQIGLIVQFDDETINTFCISFTGDSLSGYDVLQKSGLNILAAFDPIGAAICKIENTGCSIDNCFCQSPPNYWSYWHLVNNQWEYSQLGSTLTQLQNGAVEGWRWGDGKAPSVSYSIEEICIPATETPTPTGTPTQTARPIIINNDEEDNDNVPFTLYIDNSSRNGITPSPSRTPTPPIFVLTTSSPSVTAEPSTTSLSNGSTATSPPSVSPTSKIKATSLKATRITKKTQDSLQKTQENISTPTSLPIPTSTEMPTLNQTIPSNQALIKFLSVIVLLLAIGITGTLLLKKRDV